MGDFPVVPRQRPIQISNDGGDCRHECDGCKSPFVHARWWPEVHSQLGTTKKIGGLEMAKKKAAAKKSAGKKKASASSKKKVATKKKVTKKPVKKGAVAKKKPAKPAKKVVKKSVKKAAPKPVQSGASTPKAGVQEEPILRKAVTAAPVEPREADLDEEMAGEELEMEGDIEEDVQEELDLDEDDEGDGIIEKSEDLLDDQDDYRNN